MFLKIIITMISLFLILCRTSTGRGFISYIVSLYVVFKGLYLISLNTPVIFDTYHDCINSIVIILTIVITIIGIDSVFSEK